MFGSGTTDEIDVRYELDCDENDVGGIDYADGDSGLVLGPNYSFVDGCDYTAAAPGLYIVSGRSTDDGVTDERPGCTFCTNMFIVTAAPGGEVSTYQGVTW
jgi:hypothetical protein